MQDTKAGTKKITHFQPLPWGAGVSQRAAAFHSFVYQGTGVFFQKTMAGAAFPIGELVSIAQTVRQRGSLPFGALGHMASAFCPMAIEEYEYEATTDC